MTANYIMHFLFIIIFIFNVTFLTQVYLHVTKQILLQVNYTVSCDILTFIQIKFNNKQHFSHLIIICNVGYFLASLNLD